jgi:hypothetical protein
MAIEDVKPEDEIPESMRAAFEAAKAKDPDLFVLHAPDADVTVVCRRPARAIYRKFREEQDGPPIKSAHRFENLFLACLVVPTAKEFDAVLDKMPALGDSFGVAIWDRVCGTDGATVKKA